MTCRAYRVAVSPAGMLSLMILLLFSGPARSQQGLWTQGTPMPTARRYPAAAVVDGQIYVIGGSSPSGLASAVEAYDPVSDTWTTKADMPTARQALAAAVADGLIYAMGGLDGPGVSMTPRVEVYDPQTDTWTRGPDMLQVRAHFPAVALDGRIYAVGGQVGYPAFVSAVEAFDPATDTWSPVADLPRTLGDVPAAVFGDRIYVVGGQTGGGENSSQVLEYDPGTDTWTRAADKPTGMYGMAAAVVDGQIYVMGGGESYNGGFADVQAYDPAADRWRALGDMPRKSYGAAGAAVGGRAFVLGGPNLAENVWIFEPGHAHLVSSCTRELQAVAGSSSDHLIEVVLGAPSEDGTYPGLWVDVSPVVPEGSMALEYQGGGAYRGRLGLAVRANGRYSLPVRTGSADAPGKYLYSIELAVWPAVPLEILSEDIAAGWTTEQRNVEELALAQSEVVCHGGVACRVQTRRGFGGWTLTFEAPEALDLFGYESVHLAIHPGDLSPGETDRVSLTIGGVNVDLMPLVDWTSDEWREIDIPLADLGLEGAITEVQFSGTPVGTLYLDELSLLAEPPPATTAVLETRSEAVPQAFTLRQNYPNPFNSHTVIGFNLPEAARVDLALYDLLGQRVATLARGQRPAGTYTLQWDGRDDAGQPFASGTYLYRLQSAHQTVARKLVLVR